MRWGETSADGARAVPRCAPRRGAPRDTMVDSVTSVKGFINFGNFSYIVCMVPRYEPKAQSNHLKVTVI